MRKFLSLVVGIAMMFSVFGLDKPMIEIEGRITHGKEKLEGASVTIYAEDHKTIIQQRMTPANGKYAKIELVMGEVYIMEVSKKGYVPKRIIIDSKEGYRSDESPPIVMLDIPFQLHLNNELKRRRRVKRKSFFVGKLIVDKATGGMTLDSAFIAKGKEKYESHLKK